MTKNRYLDLESEMQFRSLLKACEVSQSRLAIILGTEFSTVNRWANGKLPVPRYALAYLELLAAVRAANRLPDQNPQPSQVVPSLS